MYFRPTRDLRRLENLEDRVFEQERTTQALIEKAFEVPQQCSLLSAKKCQKCKILSSVFAQIFCKCQTAFLFDEIPCFDFGFDFWCCNFENRCFDFGSAERWLCFCVINHRKYRVYSTVTLFFEIDFLVE